MFSPISHPSPNHPPSRPAPSPSSPTTITTLNPPALPQPAPLTPASPPFLLPLAKPTKPALVHPPHWSQPSPRPYSPTISHSLTSPSPLHSPPPTLPSPSSTTSPKPLTAPRKGKSAPASTLPPPSTERAYIAASLPQSWKLCLSRTQRISHPSYSRS